ncbi:MAG: hypothetical protein ABDH21_05030 [bacterium]
MYVCSPGIQFCISPNLRYYGLFKEGRVYIYRERNFLLDFETQGVDIKLLSISDNASLLLLQDNSLYLSSLDEKNQVTLISLNQYFVEGGNLHDFGLIPKSNKVFFTRKTKDRSIFARLSGKEILLQELSILNLSTRKEEVILSKKSTNQENLLLVKTSPIYNYILVADPEKLTIQLINLNDYTEELSFTIEDVEVIDFGVNNNGDCIFFIKEDNNEGIYIIPKDGNKKLIKTQEKLERYNLINFSPKFIVLRDKSQPEIVILDDQGNNYCNLKLSEMDKAGYLHWTLVFPNEEDILTIYCKQFKLPLEIYFNSYTNFKQQFDKSKAYQKLVFDELEKQDKQQKEEKKEETFRKDKEAILSSLFSSTEEETQPQVQEKPKYHSKIKELFEESESKPESQKELEIKISPTPEPNKFSMETVDLEQIMSKLEKKLSSIQKQSPETKPTYQFTLLDEIEVESSEPQQTSQPEENYFQTLMDIKNKLEEIDKQQ